MDKEPFKEGYDSVGKIGLLFDALMNELTEEEMMDEEEAELKKSIISGMVFECEVNEKEV